MYYQNYEDYMRSVLGYQTNPPDIYANYGSQRIPTQNQMMGYEPTYQDNDELSHFSEQDIHDFYPEIYHLVSPVVNRVCDANQEPISKSAVDRMTEEVYSAVEEQADIIINTRTQTPQTTEGLNHARKIETRGDRNTRKEEVTRELKREERENRRTRQRNPLLRDLIRILILNRIFGRRQMPQRPNPMPPRRPPYPGGPGRPPMSDDGRPPVRPRDYSNYLR